MKQKLLLIAVLCMPLMNWAQCTLTNATACYCHDSLQSDCDLLPDIACSKYAILNYSGPTEYAQNAGIPNQGRLLVTGSTPNIGSGPLEVRGVDQYGYKWYICDNDTISQLNPTSSTSIVPTCPDGNPNPRQLVIQRIYHKTGNTMTFWERLCGHMTYHPSHGHYHVDDWEIYTLRIPTANPNPLSWPIVGQGHKVGFCLEDYGDCSSDPMHCQDSAGNYLTNASFGQQFNLDGPYGCSPVVQGIGVGHLDIYWSTLDGQWIPIPPGTCNGQYAIVIQIDPNNFFLEYTKVNNVNWDYWNLTQQVNSNPIVTVTSSSSNVVCHGDSITLIATAGTHFAWTTGDTTQTIRVPSTSASYSCTVTTYCGTVTSAPYNVIEAISPIPSSTTGDTLCVSGNATLLATGSGTLNWYDSNNNLVGSGSTYVTPVINTTTTYYVDNVSTHNDTVYAPPSNYDMSNGSFSSTNRYLVFNCISPFTLLSVTVYSNASGNRTIDLLDSGGINVLQTTTVNIGTGTVEVPLNFNITPGNNYRLRCSNPNQLYRDNGSGVTFPYNVPGVLTIWAGSEGNTAYNFFYNWKVATVASTCPSAKVPVTAVVQICAGLGEDILFRQSIGVFPNPNNGTFSVSFETKTEQNIQIQILDMLGKVVYSKEVKNFTGKYNGVIDAKGIAKGVYMLDVKYQDKPYYTKLVIQ